MFIITKQLRFPNLEVCVLIYGALTTNIIKFVIKWNNNTNMREKWNIQVYYYIIYKIIEIWQIMFDTKSQRSNRIYIKLKKQILTRLVTECGDGINLKLYTTNWLSMT